MLLNRYARIENTKLTYFYILNTNKIQKKCQSYKMFC